MVFLGCLLTWTSCSDLDDVNSRLDKVEKEVADLQSALTVLQKAYDEGKSIKEISPVASVRGASPSRMTRKSWCKVMTILSFVSINEHSLIGIQKKE